MYYENGEFSVYKGGFHENMFQGQGTFTYP